MGNRELGERTARHFGNVVDRGGRTAPGEDDSTTVPGGVDLAAERGPHWGKGPKGYTRSDAQTREDVCDAIANQGHIDATDVEVKVESGTVTLSGTVARREHKLALERLVERCLGVREVRSELRLPNARA